MCISAGPVLRAGRPRVRHSSPTSGWVSSLPWSQRRTRQQVPGVLDADADADQVVGQPARGAHGRRDRRVAHVAGQRDERGHAAEADRHAEQCGLLHDRPARLQAAIGPRADPPRRRTCTERRMQPQRVAGGPRSVVACSRPGCQTKIFPARVKDKRTAREAQPGAVCHCASHTLPVWAPAASCSGLHAGARHPAATRPGPGEAPAGLEAEQRAAAGRLAVAAARSMRSAIVFSPRSASQQSNGPSPPPSAFCAGRGCAQGRRPRG